MTCTLSRRGTNNYARTLESEHESRVRKNSVTAEQNVELGVMAADLAETPATGVHVQVCGDCHLMNFGGFATPERRLIFDINDLDVTFPRKSGHRVTRISPLPAVG
jgi:hypothetical protein